MMSLISKTWGAFGRPFFMLSRICPRSLLARAVDQRGLLHKLHRNRTGLLEEKG